MYLEINVITCGQKGTQGAQIDAQLSPPINPPFFTTVPPDAYQVKPDPSANKPISIPPLQLTCPYSIVVDLMENIEVLQLLRLSLAL